MSKLKLSEIRALLIRSSVNDEARDKLVYERIPYLLDLVERLGKALVEYGDHSPNCDLSNGPRCTCGWKEARALLKELEL